jgi:hypothetical protein
MVTSFSLTFRVMVRDCVVCTVSAFRFVRLPNWKRIEVEIVFRVTYIFWH